VVILYDLNGFGLVPPGELDKLSGQLASWAISR
jgi:hypothetical protein